MKSLLRQLLTRWLYNGEVILVLPETINRQGIIALINEFLSFYGLKEEDAFGVLAACVDRVCSEYREKKGIGQANEALSAIYNAIKDNQIEQNLKSTV